MSYSRIIMNTNLSKRRLVAVLAGVISLVVTTRGLAGDGDWPSFRGPRACGFVQDAKIPSTWDVEKSTNVKWKTPIPGLAHSSPVVWGDRVFVTTSVSEDDDPILRVGLYGASPEHPEEIPHDFRVYCLNRSTGEILWQQTAYKGIPKVKRHIKSTHANCTPAVDGEHVVAFFGSEGLYCYDFTGKLVWKKDLGLLDAGAFNAAEIQWGFGSSPIIYKDRVIVLCDVNNQSFIAAYDLKTGKELWKTLREEVPGWGTPTIDESNGRVQAIVNGWKHIGGYNVKTGKEIWRMTGGGDIPVPTPVVADGLVYITNAHGPKAPIYAIETSAEGDITLKRGNRGKYIPWTYDRRGAYMQTPLAYKGLLYSCKDNGILTVFEAKKGKKIYSKRLGSGSTGFSASPVAAGDHIYFTSEDGDIYVIRAGKEFELLATNAMGETCLATPAIGGATKATGDTPGDTNGTLFIRGRRHLFAIGE